jgi:PKD repeat protein
MRTTLRRFPALRLIAGVLLAACGDDTGPSNAAPTAAFAVQCDPPECTFSNGSADPDGTIKAYAWDFGDGTPPVTTRDATHTYARPGGSFTVTLTVTDDDGDASTAAAQVDVDGPNRAPTASFTLACTDLTCAFTDRSFDGDAHGRVVSYNWNFGDGTPPATTRDATHTYAAAGQFTVQLTVRDDDGATATATAQASVREPNVAPTALFAVSCTDLTCRFTDTSEDPGGSVVSRVWNFGDGATSTDRDPRHTYGSGGYYDVGLTVTDDRGTTASVSFTIAVPPGDFTVTCASLECSFTPRNVPLLLDPPGWDFGDGATSTEYSPTHTYNVTEPTVFTVTFYWFDSVTGGGIASHDITVTP